MMLSDALANAGENFQTRPGRSSKWKRVPAIARLVVYLKANRTGASYAIVICQRVFTVYEAVGSIEMLEDCDANELIATVFPDMYRRGQSELRTAVVRFQKFRRAERST